MRTYTLDLPAGVEVRHAIQGRYFRILEGTGTISVRVDNGPLNDIGQGIGARQATAFASLAFKSATAQQIKVAVSDLQVDDSRFASTAPLALERGTTLKNAAVTVGTAAVTVAALDATRRAVWFTNAGSTTLYLGKGGVTTAVGFPLLPGSTLAFDQAAGALWQCISSSAGGDLRVIEELD